MKKTVSANIGSLAFIIDEDAFMTLSSYLDQIRMRISEDDPDEIVNDIESRIAEIFTENITSRSQVVNIELVKRAMAIIGKPELFGEQRYTTLKPEQSKAIKFYRSRKDNVLAGICGGIAEYFNIDVAVVRLVTFILIFFGGISLWVYIILWITVPVRPIESDFFTENKNRRL